MSTNEVIEGTIVPADTGNLLAASTGRELVDLASERAKALAEVIEKQKLYVDLSGRRHVRVEGWTLLGSMMGVFPVTDTVTEIYAPDGSSRGFEARVEARTLAGALVGAAIARCTRDEKNWDTRKGQRVDDYALMSMAQTRATSKALRMPLGYVMQLAGFETTPAEEMSHESPHTSATAEPPEPTDQERRGAAWARTRAVLARGKVTKETAERITSIIGADLQITAGAEAVADAVEAFEATGELPSAPAAPSGDQPAPEPSPATERVPNLIERIRELAASDSDERALFLRSIAELIEEMGLSEPEVRHVLGHGGRRSVVKALEAADIEALGAADDLLGAEYQRRQDARELADAAN